MVNVCHSIADDFTNWPDTPAGSEAVMPCLPSDQHIAAALAEFEAAEAIGPAEKPDSLQLQLLLQSTANATKLCMENATWHPIANYSQCIAELTSASNATEDAWDQAVSEIKDKINITQMTGHLYLTGGILSMASIIAALSIFFTFRRLRCLRNYIHAQLLLSFLIKYTMWFIIYCMQNNAGGFDGALCNVFGVVMVYAIICQFTWMFLEALNIVITIFRALAPGTIALKPWLLIGWGTPVPVVIVWVIFNFFNPGSKPGICLLPHYDRSPLYNGDLIYAIPLFLLLVANFVLMGLIIWILLTKLRHAANSQVRPLTSCTRQTIKATLVLIPLLGLNHVLWVYPPDDSFTLRSLMLLCLNMALQSLQGFWVSLCYCFLNGEVKCTLSANIRRLKESWTAQTSVNDPSKSHPKFRGTALQPTHGHPPSELIYVLRISTPSEAFSSTC